MKYFLILFILSSSCYSQVVVAHRGASREAPDNTLPAFELAWKQGAQFIEADFHLTADDQVVCFHDAQLLNNHGKTIKIKSTNWRDLQSIDIGKEYGERWENTSIPLLSQVLDTIPPKKGIFIEIKSKRNIIPHLKKVIDQSKVKYSQIHFISFDVETLVACKNLMPKAKTQWLIGIKKDTKTGELTYTTNDIIKVLNILKADGVGTNYQPALLKPNNIEKLQDAGFYWNVWTVNSNKEARKLKKIGVDYITTDTPAKILKTLK